MTYDLEVLDETWRQSGAQLLQTGPLHSGPDLAYSLRGHGVPVLTAHPRQRPFGHIDDAIAERLHVVPTRPTEAVMVANGVEVGVTHRQLLVVVGGLRDVSQRAIGSQRNILFAISQTNRFKTGRGLAIHAIHQQVLGL